MREKTLFLGYGNPDRGDDGVAWHLINLIFSKQGKGKIDLFDSDIITLNNYIDVWFNFQLVPEISELISTYQKALFIDAHTGEIKADLNFQEIYPVYQNSPFTHHMTPESLLSLAKSINGICPRSWLLSIHGFSFEFDRKLSSATNKLCVTAYKIVRENFLN